ncbi:SDH family Clp fold serine proteinase [Portibacter marinus]|uniref:SDH family Clp fold serine proteinase n=1 Tax=Portibacter marinus TaxID=2898660 RepID=UPI001F3E5F72|nr:hypothetical protein [Portibacter marinus]
MTKKSTETNVKATNQKEADEIPEIKDSELFSHLFKGYGPEDLNPDKRLYKDLLTQYLKQEISKHPVSKKYDLVILFDDSTMMKSDADKVYNSVTKFTKDKPLLLVLFSSGGNPGSAYLIGKLCREYSNGKMVVVIPRYAKSAATLLCCAANEIHMGSLSELGPIDPQINGLPALGLKNSIEHIADLVKENPDSADLFAKYLSLSIEPIQIGYYERVAESAMQYAENLLSTHKENLPRDAKSIAYDLVYKYKDHGFVIDKTEAIKILGNEIIKGNTDEYDLGNRIYQILESQDRLLTLLKHNFYFIGSEDSEATINKRR